jgi:Holliday junction resolvase RusA-like endonuclease
MSLEIVVHGPPVGAARPRVVRLKTGASHTFMPDKPVAWEERARQAAVQALGGQGPMEGPVTVRVEAHHSRPGKLRRKKDPRCAFHACRKPDHDNVAKLALDALTKAELWTDDKLVRDLRIVDRGRCAGGRVVVWVRPLKE